MTSGGWASTARVEVGDDGTARLTADEAHLNRHGTVHGGAIATLCDIAMGAAVSAAGVDDAVTIEMKITYLRPADPGELRADAHVRKVGERITAVTAEVMQDDELIALATGTFTGTG